MTEHFSLDELIASQTAEKKGIKNIPGDDVMAHLQRTAEGLERIRSLIGDVSVHVLSGYRCPELNKAIGGVKSSQHVMGQAADIVAPKFGDVHTLSGVISMNAEALGVDKVIKEKNSMGAEWVHVSFRLKPRHLSFTYRGGKYLKGILV